MSTAAMNRTTIDPAPTTPDAPHSNAVMRQTQALIGTVLLASAAAAYFVHIAWLIIPTIIGCGLIFAGTSGLCPMASLVARMPWNRSAEARHHASAGGCCGGRCA